ncbi:MAG: hypothetical protein IJ091_03305, partial [Oscillospiraceae bacterium]|nr:hypothetical protein [Oscillospiraceae bacterium]
ADIIIQSIPPVGSDLPSGYRMVDYKKVYTFNNALIKMCEERGLHYLNVTEDVWRSSDGHCKSEYITSDGIHLEQTAYERLLTYVRTHALLTEDTRPELTEKLTRKAAPVVVYQYQCDVVVTSAMESFYDEGYVDYKKVKEGDKEENYKDPDTYKFTIPKADATKGSEEEMGQALFKSVNSQVKKKDKAQIAISYKISEDGDYVFTVTVKEVCTHEYETKDYVEATCTHAGSKTLVCKICGKKTVTTTEMLDHEYDWDTAHDYKDGKITVKCKLCEKEYEVAHGENDHDWNEGTVVKEPTCTDKGSKQSKCTICGIEKEIEIPALGHDYVVDTANSVAATCTEAGTNSYKCSRCGNTDKPSETVAALGHDFSKVYSETPATCTESGSRTYCCSRCGTLSPSDPEIIPAKGHSFSSGPTCDNCPEPNPNYQPPVEQPPEGEDEG